MGHPHGHGYRWTLSCHKLGLAQVTLTATAAGGHCLVPSFPTQSHSPLLIQGVPDSSVSQAAGQTVWLWWLNSGVLTQGALGRLQIKGEQSSLCLLHWKGEQAQRSPDAVIHATL